MTRVISGKFKGINLDVFPNRNMRPTSCRVKEALFDIIQFEIKGKSFVDLFSGTGQIGIEALSRGSSKVYFVDNCLSSIKMIKENLHRIDTFLNKNFEIHKSDFTSFVNNFGNKVDILFSDAPFDMNVSQDIFKNFTKIAYSTIITETLYSNVPVIECNNFCLQKRYKYGKISLNLYRNKNK